MAYNLGFEQGDKASTPYTNCEHYDTCTDPKYDPTHDPHYKPEQEPSPCLAGNVDTCSTAFASKPLQSICPPIDVASLQCGTGAVVPSQVTPQPHTAAYLQALNSGSPNPHKPGTKDYQHYRAGLLARQQNGEAGPGIVTPGGTTSNNNNNPSTTKKCPDGSIIPAKDKCPALTQTNPSSTPTGSSTPSSPSGSLSTPSGGSSSGGKTGSGGGSSDSSSSSGGGNGGSSSSSGSSSDSSSNSDSGSHHRH